MRGQQVATTTKPNIYIFFAKSFFCAEKQFCQIVNFNLEKKYPPTKLFCFLLIFFFFRIFISRKLCVMCVQRLNINFQFCFSTFAGFSSFFQDIGMYQEYCHCCMWCNPFGGVKDQKTKRNYESCTIKLSLNYSYKQYLSQHHSFKFHAFWRVCEWHCLLHPKSDCWLVRNTAATSRVYI